MICPNCSTENREGVKFCVKCGHSLASSCPSCGSAYQAEDLFCPECGFALGSGTEQAPTPARKTPTAERRLVSVLFADLVGFTALSEDRDAEEVRELLSRYFESCQRLIDLYGGTVEKFIGDAVMAVWGTPVAQEDDAERAVRAGLDLVASVTELHPDLLARAGVLTGEAAVTLGADGQGMVAGDLVNTASRVQAEAEPGTVLVGEATKRLTEAAIAYEDAGEHELKGKSEPVALYRALRVTAHRGGALKAAGLEPPFVGRERELRLVKELFHASAEEKKAHLVSVIGTGGMGKSRLTWELEKYLDGLAESVYWHRGRCVAYGEGVTYWALTEMVRMRAQIAEGEDPAAAREKLRESVEAIVPDPEDRAWVEPRLAHLLGLERRKAHEREDLFAGWRLFFERMAERQPVLMVFDDMQWADPSLLEFVEYLLEWSRSHAIFVLTLARPELVERHPQWGAGRRNFTSLTLEPLPAEAMEALLAALVPGLSGELGTQILARAEGVPLYAVETVRMLLDRNLLEREGDIYRPTGPIDALDVPETLHALVAARLDGLEPAERGILQDAAVLGRTFTTQALAAVSGTSRESLAPVLTTLVRKEVLSVQADPRSPERGQYGFVQDLLKKVAYDTLARKERKARHLAAASYLNETFGPGQYEVVEVVAAHYLGAFEAGPKDEDAPAIKAMARETLTRAGERARSLAAGEEAERYFEQAAELSEDSVGQAELLERAGEMAWAAGRIDRAQVHYERALELFEAAGETHPAARVSARLGEVEWTSGEIEAAIERMERALAVLSADEPDADFAALAAQLGRLHFFNGNFERASEILEVALNVAEDIWLPEILSQAMNTYGLIAFWRGRAETGLALFMHSLKMALEHDLPTPALRAYNNIADHLCSHDRYDEALVYHDGGIALARKVGNRQQEWSLLLESAWPLTFSGRWDEALARAAEVPESQLETLVIPSPVACEIEAARGRTEEARRVLELFAHRESSADVQQQALYRANASTVLFAEERYDEALVNGEEAFAARRTLGNVHVAVKEGFAYGVEAAFALGRLEKVEELVAQVEALRPGQMAPFLRAHALRFRARLAAARGQTEVEPRFAGAESIFREFGIPFWLAVTQLEHAELLLAQDRRDEAEPLLAEAREVFERLEATPWLERAARGLPAARAPEAVTGRS